MEDLKTNNHPFVAKTIFVALLGFAFGLPIAVASCDGAAGSCAPADPFCNPEMFALYTNMLPPGGSNTTPEQTPDYQVDALLGTFVDHATLYSYQLDSSTGAVTGEYAFALGTGNTENIATSPDGSLAAIGALFNGKVQIVKITDAATIDTSIPLYTVMEGQAEKMAFYSKEDGSHDLMITGVDNSSPYDEFKGYNYSTASGLVPMAGNPLGTSCNTHGVIFSSTGLSTMVISDSTTLNLFTRSSVSDSFVNPGTTLSFPLHGQGEYFNPFLTEDNKDLYINQGLSLDSYRHFRIDESGGTLTDMGTSAALGSGNFRSMAQKPGTQYIYVGFDSGEIYGALRDETTGDLTTLSGFPVTPDGNLVNHVFVGPQGKYLYAVTLDTNFGYIYAYTINADHSLSLIAGSPYTMSYRPTDMEISNKRVTQ